MDTDYLEDRKLQIYAEAMDISVEELDQLSYREDSETSEDGLIYSHYLEFSDENPWRIMVKIKGLQDRFVYFSPSIFETDDSEPD